MKTAIIQSGPVYLDLDKSMEKALELLMEAADDGADLVVFGETWLSGYPVWLDICPEAALWDHGPSKAVYARMHDSAIVVPGPETDALCGFARDHGVAICIGANEKVLSGPGNGTLYNTLLLIDQDGQLANHHRKLMPTYGERLVHGPGDGAGLHAMDTPWGRIGGLICWEHWMPLTRQAMHDSGEHIHLALWPQVKAMNQVASQHYAFEGRCYVIAAGQIMRAHELPEELDIPAQFEGQPDALLMHGGACAYAPDGSCILEPQYGNEGIVWLQIDDLQMPLRERMNLDVSGHYQRRDVFDFKVDKKR